MKKKSLFIYFFIICFSLHIHGMNKKNNKLSIKIPATLKSTTNLSPYPKRSLENKAKKSYHKTYGLGEAYNLMVRIGVTKNDIDLGYIVTNDINKTLYKTINLYLKNKKNIPANGLDEKNITKWLKTTNIGVKTKKCLKLLKRDPVTVATVWQKKLFKKHDSL
ncbi:hypothetical protein KAH94_00005, partial [bacterium]|nr:hypothetical protein [bacterium]